MADCDKIDYLRISVTDRCNFRCIYCVPRESITLKNRRLILSFEEILRFARIAVSSGIRKVRVTGGEPFARKGVVDFLKRLVGVPGLSNVSLTTNASLIGPHLDEIQDIGIKSINVSLDTLNAERFHRLTGSDSFLPVFQNIRQLMERNFTRLRLNMVVMGGINDDEIVSIAELAKGDDVEVRFIETMPFFALCQRPGALVPAKTIKEKLRVLGELEPVVNAEGKRVVKLYRIQGFKGRLGLITPMTEPFCASCNRIRLTADGKLKACLVENAERDVSRALKDGRPDEEISRVIEEVIRNKPRKHEPVSGHTGIQSGRTMCEIGG